MIVAILKKRDRCREIAEGSRGQHLQECLAIAALSDVEGDEGALNHVAHKACEYIYIYIYIWSLVTDGQKKKGKKQRGGDVDI